MQILIFAFAALQVTVNAYVSVVIKLAHLIIICIYLLNKVLVSSHSLPGGYKCVCELFSAEFIVSLADKHPTFESFKKVLIENGASFSVRI